MRTGIFFENAKELHEDGQDPIEHGSYAETLYPVHIEGNRSHIFYHAQGLARAMALHGFRDPLTRETFKRDNVHPILTLDRTPEQYADTASAMRYLGLPVRDAEVDEDLLSYARAKYPEDEGLAQNRFQEFQLAFEQRCDAFAPPPIEHGQPNAERVKAELERVRRKWLRQAGDLVLSPSFLASMQAVVALRAQCFERLQQYGMLDLWFRDMLVKLLFELPPVAPPNPAIFVLVVPKDWVPKLAELADAFIAVRQRLYAGWRDQVFDHVQMVAHFGKFIEALTSSGEVAGAKKLAVLSEHLSARLPSVHTEEGQLRRYILNPTSVDDLVRIAFHHLPPDHALFRRPHRFCEIRDVLRNAVLEQIDAPIAHYRSGAYDDAVRALLGTIEAFYEQDPESCLIQFKEDPRPHMPAAPPLPARDRDDITLEAEENRQLNDADTILDAPFYRNLLGLSPVS